MYALCMYGSIITLLNKVHNIIYIYTTVHDLNTDTFCYAIYFTPQFISQLRRYFTDYMKE